MEDFIFDKFLPTIVVPMAAFALYIIFVWIPVHLSNESECLAKGYPKTNTTVSLDGYCTNIEGAVTGKVEKLK